MPVFLFFRHGPIAPDWRDKFYGQLDIPLSEEGKSKSEEAVEHLLRIKGLAGVYSSPLQRALYPAKLLSEKTGLVLEIDPLLMEINYGIWAGKKREEVMQEPLFWQRLQDENLAPPKGECLRELRLRARLFWEKLKTKKEEGVWVIFTHGGFLRALYGELFGLEQGFFFSVEVLHLRAMVVVNFLDGNFVLRGLNVSPLEIEDLLQLNYW